MYVCMYVCMYAYVCELESHNLDRARALDHRHREKVHQGNCSYIHSLSYSYTHIHTRLHESNQAASLSDPSIAAARSGDRVILPVTVGDKYPAERLMNELKSKGI